MTALLVLVSSTLVLEEAICMGNSFSSGEKCEKCSKINIAVVRFNTKGYCTRHKYYEKVLLEASSLIFSHNAAKGIFSADFLNLFFILGIRFSFLDFLLFRFLLVFEELRLL